MLLRNKLFIFSVLLILGLSFVSSLSPSYNEAIEFPCCWEKLKIANISEDFKNSCTNFNLTVEYCKIKVYGHEKDNIIYNFDWRAFFALLLVLIIVIIYFLRKRKKGRKNRK